MNGCFSVYRLSDMAVFTYRGVIIYTEDLASYMKLIAKIGMKEFQQLSDGLFEAIGAEAFHFIKNNNLSFRLVIQSYSSFTGNFDLFTEAGEMLCRGSKYDLYHFMQIFVKPDYYKRQTLEEIINLMKESKYVYNAEKAAEWFDNFIIPASQRGLAPDYSSLYNVDYLGKKIIYEGNAKYANIKIKMSGMRSMDEKLANEAAGLIGTPEGYTWHHLDDFDPVTGECTMQLVSEAVHMKILKKLDGSRVKLLSYMEHTGSVALWQHFYLASYK